ncbi:hypothetical protein [Avibacterium paragallinarum]|uniref:hypothetical protein n=1 Tax=Avibacterium paragallinarum TaxID=728 RepID=UPI00397B8E55
MEFSLKHGLMFGDEPQLDVETRDLNTGDLIEAECAAERLLMDGQGNPVLVVSSVLFNYELVRRQIKRVGKINEPLSLKQLGSLHREDLDIINAMLSAQEIAKSTQALDQRGRLEATDKDI